MSALTGKRPTEKRPAEGWVHARITLPLKQWPEARRALRAMKIKVEEEDELIPWRQAFPDLKDEDMPGLHLKAARRNAGLTQIALSERTGIPQRHLSEMENGKRPIGRKTAGILAPVLAIDYRLLM